MLKPIAKSYWVEPGKLLAGEYPRRYDDHCDTFAKLEALVDAGVDVFVDLTEDAECKPYADKLCGRARHVRYGIVDQHTPRSPEFTCAILDAIDAYLAAGEVVYMHCLGGIGRTGTVVGCWLARHLGTGQGGYDRLQELWADNPKSAWRSSPETSEQKAFVLAWTEPLTDGAPSLRDRYRGAMLGMAAGDAVGTTLEFKAPGSFTPITDMVGGGPFHLKAGEWTDDTSMALCLARSLTKLGGFDPADQMQRYVRWRDEGYMASNGHCFDIGITISGALSRYVATGKAYTGSQDPNKAGNGSLVRLAPVPLYYAADPELAVFLSGLSSMTTHGALTCVAACRYYAALIVGALQGVPKKELLSDHYAPVQGMYDRLPLCPEIDEIAAGSFKTKELPEIIGSGYVVKALEAALWAFYRSSDFREGCLMAANLGDDADTTAAIYGQLAGAFYGVAGIPQGWQKKLVRGDLIESLADALYEKAVASKSA